MPQSMQKKKAALPFGLFTFLSLSLAPAHKSEMYGKVDSPFAWKWKFYATKRTWQLLTLTHNSHAS